MVLMLVLFCSGVWNAFRMTGKSRHAPPPSQPPPATQSEAPPIFPPHPAANYNGASQPHSQSFPSGPSTPSGDTSYSRGGGVAMDSGKPMNYYSPVTHHWFYCRNVELRQIWQPMSISDSTRLEDAYQSGERCLENSGALKKVYADTESCGN